MTDNQAPDHRADDSDNGASDQTTTSTDKAPTKPAATRQRRVTRTSRVDKSASSEKSAAETTPRHKPAAEAAGPDKAGAAASPGGASRGSGRTRRVTKTERPRSESVGEADRNPELPDRHIEGRPKDVEAAEKALVRKPQIGDSRPAPEPDTPAPADNRDSDSADGSGQEDGGQRRRRRRGGRGRGGGGGQNRDGQGQGENSQGGGGKGHSQGQNSQGGGGKGKGQGGSSRGGGSKGQGGGGRSGQKNRQGQGRKGPAPVEIDLDGEEAPELDEEQLKRRRGRSRNGKPVGRYSMNVHVQPDATQIAVMEGRHLIEHYVSRPSDDVFQIHGNIYVGRVQNVLPGMEAAFVDIGTPKNAVLYRGDVQYDAEDIESKGPPKIEQMLKARQTIICQVTKNPIAHKGARLTQEVSLPGRFVVLIPNSSTYGISKRLPDPERKRLRKVLDGVKPPQHGLIVRTAAENVTADEIERDVKRLADQWVKIEALAQKAQGATLLYREPDMAVRVIREEFNKDYRSVIIDDKDLYEEVKDYVAIISPALAERVEYFDRSKEQLPLFERQHVHQQLRKAVDRKVWLPSGGSLIIEHTEALTVIDVNTGKNVGRSSLEDTVFHNNTEAAVEIARQLRLRDIGGIIVIDFVDMEVAKNRAEVGRVFREALSRDKTRTQVFDISELGLVEMTRKRIGEGLIESLSTLCADCEGRGLILHETLLDPAKLDT
ncbi:MAG: Rne/Rng family ribonuclease [Actinomycetia bacterium]|nr:Rne/Rng family ribonuclease [Actinomycetes bacterium]